MLEAGAVREIIEATWPQRFAPGQVRDDTPLGEDGLGLDSVEVVEVILACEEQAGRRATEALFAALPLTPGRIARHFASS
jgi:acyl carrier protein